MKYSLLSLFLCTALLAQAVAPTAKRPEGVPENAISSDGVLWRWTDKDGKKWVGKQGPFGLYRTEEPKIDPIARPKEVPADATDLSPGVWRWQDKEGKVWIYQATPSGLMKTVQGSTPFAKEAAPEPEDKALALISVKEEGGKLKFSKPGPFGLYTWTKDKNDLNKDEQAVWQRHQKSGQAKK